MVNFIPRLWTTPIRKLLKPEALVNSVVSCAKLACRWFSGFVYNGSNIRPVAYGSLYEPLETPVSLITKKAQVAGNAIADDSLISGEVVDNSKYVWQLRGVGAGIIRFGKSLSGTCGLLGEDFIYENGVYLFKTNPVNFGNVEQDSAGLLVCKFLVTYGVGRTIEFLDTFNTTKGALDSTALWGISRQRAVAEATGNLSSYALLAACGIRPLVATGKIKACWRESDKYLAVTEDGDMLIDIAKNPSIFPGAYISPETCVSSAVRENIIVAVDRTTNPKQPVYYWAPGDAKIRRSDLPPTHWKGDADNSIISAVEFRALSDEVFTAYDTTKGPADPGSAIGLNSLITTTSNFRLIQKVCVKAPNKLLKGADKVLLFVSNNSQSLGPLSDTDLRHVVATNKCVELGNIYKSNGTMYAISLNARNHNTKLVAGSYITGIGLASSKTNSILKHIQINPTVVKAGATVALAVNIE